MRRVSLRSSADCSTGLGRRRRGCRMKRSICVICASALCLAASQITSATAQEQEPVCGPPGEEVPVTIVGAGNINGTPGDDVILGSAGADNINAGPGDDIICAEGGNDSVNGGPGNDTLI